jgi:hypothetical protein
MATFEPVRFIPAQRQSQILASPVTRIVAVPHVKQGGTNHWCLYLSTSPTRSIRLDCQPSYSVPSTAISGGSKAILIVSELPYAVSHDAQAQFALDVIPGLTVAHIHDKLIQHGRHRYEFDANGVGCRCWTSNQIDLLHQLQLITKESQVSAAKNGILKLWPDQTPLPLDQGAYYQ